ncbi:MAG: bifunctional phosphoribosylaminoimidazolecarboxamide formyltransferase/IMP cyclohydrolase [Chloroflexi bacterium]|nr:bifunctional phosphoribosylaminoimidazolecarboxamide formyltransferase/IMP cyclohydrolase [Chloroflexota bacterium]MBV9600629.1 bifunctional phosphoribosylaminoimidazolecarboxamide formyltransferase/IMP cyclohydrolase [Chloroflexota bacterium]
MRAILSVYDKTGVVDFARGLEALGVELFSTGGTEGLLREAGINVRGVQEITGFPEMLGGRVKTLHPAVHGGILALRDDPGHLEEMARHGLQPIDVVVSNLYPFLSVARDSGTQLAVALDNIDIGGHTLLRAAAKNFLSVLAICDPRDYDAVLQELERDRGVSADSRRRLAAKAFQHCAVYDTHVALYLRPHDEIFPDEYTIALRKLTDMRSGENPHQLAAFYGESSPRPRPPGLTQASQLHGKAPSFNNTYDADLAWQAVLDFTSTAVAIVKHGNLCGLSLGESVADAFRKALATDPQTAFGSAVAANRVIDDEAAREIAAVFFEDLVAPDFAAEALAILKRKSDLRVFATHADVGGRGSNGSNSLPGEFDYKRVLGGFLVQTPDALPEQSFTPRVVTQRQPVLAELTSLYFAWRAVKHVTSNGVVLARGLALVGFGSGQPSRQDAVDLACRKAGDRAGGSVLASDGFFPFPDTLERAADAGVTAVIQPGGSSRDPELIRVANRHGMAMIFTGERHYRH